MLKNCFILTLIFRRITSFLQVMSDSGITDDDCFKSDVMNNLTKKSATQSPSIDSPPSICKGSNGDLVKRGIHSDTIGSGSSSPLLDMTPLPAEDLSICPYCNKNYRKVRFLKILWRN
jgi:hypothetical protein